MYAIIHDGGKQYKVMPGESVELEFKMIDIGSPVELDKVVFYNNENEKENEKEILVGQPYLTNIKVKGIIEQQHLGDKIDIMKWRKNGTSHTIKGHRQIYTRVRVCQIVKE